MRFKESTKLQRKNELTPQLHSGQCHIPQNKKPGRAGPPWASPTGAGTRRHRIAPARHPLGFVPLPAPVTEPCVPLDTTG